MPSVTDKIKRQTAIKMNMDPFGTQWGISLIEGTALYVIGKAPESGEGPVVPPKTYPHIGDQSSGMEGTWTKTDLAQKAIESYLTNAWDYSDEQAAKNERKQARAELSKEAA